MKNKMAICITILLISPISLAENKVGQDVEDLEKKLLTVFKREKIDVLNQLASAYCSKSPKKCIEYGNQALELSKKLKYKKGETNALRNIVYGYNILGNNEKSFEYCHKALSFFEKLDDKENIADYTKDIGNIYRRMGEYDKALEYYFKSLKIFEEIKDKKGISDSLNNVGVIYFNFKKYNKALEYYFKALQIDNELGDKKSISVSFENIGLTYAVLENFDLALEYLFKAKNIYDELGLKDRLSSIFLNIGLLFTGIKNYKKAEKYLLDSFEIAEELGQNHEITIVLNNLAAINIDQDKFNKALVYLSKSLSIAKEIKARDVVKDIYKNFSEIYEAKADYNKALAYYKLYFEMNESLFNEDASKQLAEMQAKYDTLKKEKEIQLLKKDNHVQKITRNALIFGLILIMIIFVLLFRKYLYLFAFWKKKNYIAHYRVTGKIASGGMATIYRGHVVQDKTRTLAIKVLKDEYFSDESYKKRFRNEAIIIDQLNHPHIVKVIERGEYEDTLYIAMELLEGRTLGEMLREEKILNLAVALNIMIQVADALVKIHQKKIIHRDLKPDNIMLTKRNENPYYVKVLDFGLAKSQSLTQLTQTGHIMGTIFFLSPEQLVNKEITTASDVYSLGVIYYQMLCGEMPFFADTAVEIAKQILEKDPLNPSKFNRDIPKELNQLIMKMVNKNPTQRPSAEDVLNTLNCLLNEFVR